MAFSAVKVENWKPKERTETEVSTCKIWWNLLQRENNEMDLKK